MSDGTDEVVISHHQNRGVSLVRCGFGLAVDLRETRREGARCKSKTVTLIEEEILEAAVGLVKRSGQELAIEFPVERACRNLAVAAICCLQALNKGDHHGAVTAQKLACGWAEQLKTSVEALEGARVQIGAAVGQGSGPVDVVDKAG